MKLIKLLVITAVLSGGALSAQEKTPPPNRLIDYKAFMANAAEVDKIRAKNRVSEEAFIRMAAEPGTIVYDARSDSKFALLHIKGAKHLSFTDVTTAELVKILPDKSTRILIYCNNNFKNEPISMATKAAPASLNIYTFNTLYSYGYTNVYELGPLIDIKKSKLSFEGSLVSEKK